MIKLLTDTDTNLIALLDRVERLCNSVPEGTLCELVTVFPRLVDTGDIRPHRQYVAILRRKEL